MINLRNSPFFWFSLLLLMAYIIMESAGLDLICHFSMFLWVMCIICSMVSVIRYNPGKQFISSIAIAILIIAAGLLRITDFTTTLYPAAPLDGLVHVTGELEVKQVLKQKEHAVSLRCHAILLKADKVESYTIPGDPFILVQIKEPKIKSFYPGDRLKFQGWLSALKAPLNPEAFDARMYYNTLGIRHQVFCKGEEITPDSVVVHSISRLTAQWQTYLSTIVKQHTSAEVAQLTNALVWGDRSDMNAEVRDAFADSGAMHVLSVSGMHVAIIFSMLQLFIGAPGRGSFAQRMLKFGAYAIAIIIYMGLSGACPAVVRAGLMIIMYLFGKAMGWNTEIWNLLGFAAFIMLWLNPYLWHNIGFQLSFLAIAGILLFAKPIIRCITLKIKVLHLMWEITALSIAAQVFILPILLKQFHQFPLTFIASSLVAMPASYLIIFGAIINVIFSLIGIDWLWPSFDLVGRYFILCMKWMAGLNPAMNFSLPSPANGFLIGMAIVFSCALVYRWPFGKKIAYGLGFCALINLTYNRLKQWHENDITIYYSYNGLLVDVISEGRCISIQDSSLTEEGIEFSSRGYRCYRDVIDTKQIGVHQEFYSPKIQYKNSLLSLPFADLLIWDGTLEAVQMPAAVTHIIIEHCPDTKRLRDFICSKPEAMVLLPAHLDKKTGRALEKMFRQEQIQFYNVGSKGYFQIHI